MHLKPFYKYTGGKIKEMKNIQQFFPSSGVERVVEPFCGSCSTAFHFELPALVSDINDHVTNLLSVVKSPELFSKLMDKIKETNITETKTEENNKHLETLYYKQRDDYFTTTDPVEKAYRYLIIRQLCFSGMTRVNSKTGKSNVPYGWYGLFKTRLDVSYHNMLQNWDIKNQSFEKTIAETTETDWILVDPPYYQRNSKYGVNSDAGESEDFHIKLSQSLKKTSAQWLLIHSDCDLYRELYKDFNIRTKDFQYAQNFKGRDMKKSKVQHLYITNY
jgi:DNA adenine methylase